MRGVLIVGVMGMLLVASAVHAQRDAVKIGEGMSVTRIPVPSVSVPVPLPQPQETINVPPLADTSFESQRMIGVIDVDVRRASPYIRDAINFLKSWGRRDDALLSTVSTPSTTVQLPGATLTPFRDVRLTLPASGLQVVERTTDRVVMRVRTLYVRDGPKNAGRLRAHRGVLTLARDGSGYRVTSVVVE